MTGEQTFAIDALAITRSMNMKVTPWRARNTPSTTRTDLESWIDDFFNGNPRAANLPETFRRGPMPLMNLAETPKEFSATLELPGLDEKDIEIQVIGNRLIVSGERKWEKESKDKEFFCVESEYGSFRRQIDLPDGLVTDHDAVKATFAKGLLEIRIPKVEPKPAVKVKVNTT
jgi:HSP20 family protein